ncbi:anthranilate phosphoribosyltransferase [Fodinisporobacter ferrooxydans]|uniref:Anthranilate phosphoribosyltransferase n=1 Tax=Fodinisporobacter ferrooxydans TaxID=2901836 RepID=A0ABY4CPD4_9BACL|nr:anthranilate phosphoribosyltransferase [Alicyclobacillaceae bacterium MYW30-H2]
MFSTTLRKVADGQMLLEQEAYAAMQTIMQGDATPAQIAGFLTALRLRGETVDEIVGFANAMRSFAVPFASPYQTFIDTCGTGGDGADTFNISTAAAFVVAAAGVPVAKHGNRAVSSKSGSADVLQQLGVEIQLSQEEAQTCFREVGVCFMFAPLYHPAMKHAVGPRKELGFRTVFNVLGPLTNPAMAPRQVLGVYNENLVAKIAQVMARLGTEHALIVHGAGGLDELSVCGSTTVAEVKDGSILEYSITPEQLGMDTYPLSDIRGGDALYNAQMIREVLAGKRSDGARGIVALNAAASLYVGGLADSLRAGVKIAEEMIDSGKAYDKLQQLSEFTQELTGLRMEHQKEIAQ